MSEENKSLIVLASQANSIEQMLIEASGELTPEIEAILSIRDTQLPEKVDSYYFIMERMKAGEAFYKEKADMFSKAAKSFKNAQETLKERLKLAMVELTTDELRGNAFRFKLSAGKPSVLVTDEDAIPREYFEEVTEFVLKKDRLSEDLKIGEVPGAVLDQTMTLRSFVNSPNAPKKVTGAK